MALTINFKKIDFKFKLSERNSAGNEINNNLRSKSRKCLFGPPDPEETFQMAKENFACERERFYQRFGIHMDDLDKLAIDEEEYKKSKRYPVFSANFAPSALPVGGGGGKMVNRKLGRVKRILKPYNVNNQPQSSTQQQQQQMKMTDFCQVKKSPCASLQADCKQMPSQQQQHQEL